MVYCTHSDYGQHQNHGGLCREPGQWPRMRVGETGLGLQDSEEYCAPSDDDATDATFGSQTFGLSSVTSGCTNDGKVMAGHLTNKVVVSTFDTL